MSLRLTLLCLGLVILAGVFLYSRGYFQALFSKRLKLRSISARKDPVIDGSSDIDDSAYAVESSEPDTRLEDDEPHFGRLHQVGQVEKPPAAKKVFAIRLVPENDETFPAETLVLALRAAGLAHGDLGIFHRVSADGGNAGTFCVANLVEPGSFDLAKLQESSYPGISLFMILPMQAKGLAVFDEMLAVGRGLADSLGGILLDESGSRLSVQRERYLREEVIEFERRHRTGAGQS